MPINVDFAVLDSGGNIKTMVEVKAKQKTSDTWAAVLRRNLYAHGQSRNVKYFLLITLDRIYLWENLSNYSDSAMLPSFVVNTSELWKKISSWQLVNSRQIDGRAFEFIVYDWIRDVNENRTNGRWDYLPQQLLDAVSGQLISEPEL